jgi:hypothetical protein
MESYNNNGRNSNNGMRDNNEPSKDEKAVVMETNDEFKRRGLFKRVFPTMDFLYYK